MKFKILLISLLFVLFAVNVFAVPTVTITPHNPLSNNNLLCSVSEVQSQEALIFEWRRNGVIQESNLISVDSQGSHYLNSLTSWGDRISCTAYFLGNNIGTDTVKLNDAPTADAGSDQTVNFGELVTFDGSASTDPDGTIVRYQWNFGDGTAEEGRVVNHLYARTGTFRVTLTVTDNIGVTDADTALVTVNQRAGASNLVIEFPRVFKDQFRTETNDIIRGGNLFVRLHVFNSATGANVPNRVNDLTVTLKNRNTGRTFTLVPFTGSTPEGSVVNGQRSGLFNVLNGVYYYRLSNSVSLTDDVLGVNDLIAVLDGARTDINLNILNKFPSAVISGSDRTVNVNTNVRFDASRSSDLEDPRNALQFVWDFGDNTARTNDLTTDHIFNTPGIYTVSLGVRDSDNGFTIKTIKVTVNGPGAPGVGHPSFTVSDLNPFVLDTISFDASLSTVTNSRITNYQWNFGDGSTASGSLVEHIFNEPGRYTVTLTITSSNNVKYSTSKVLNVRSYDSSNPEEPDDNDRPGMRQNRADFDKQGSLNVRRSTLHSFKVAGITPLNFKTTYHPGDNIFLVLNLRNEGNSYENLNLKLSLLNLNVPMQVSSVRLAPGSNVLKQLSIHIPENTKNGLYSAKVGVDNGLGDVALTYWQFKVAF